MTDLFAVQIKIYAKQYKRFDDDSSKKDESCHPGYCYASQDTTRPYLWLKHILDDDITDDITDAIIIGEYTL